MQDINWVPLSKHKIVKSNLVYSPAQITEHQKVELKDHNASKETKQQFEELKAKYSEVFSINNEDIGHTQLVTIDIDTGDSPPVCQKLYALPLKHYSWVQQEIETLEWAGVIKRASAPGLVLLSLYLRNLHVVNPLDVECALTSGN